MTSRPTLRHWLEYAAVQAASLLARGAGRRASDAFGRGLGRLAYRPFGIRRAVVEEHLRRAFPDQSGAWVHATAAAAYAHIGAEAMALLRLAGDEAEQVLARTEVVGLEALRAALAAGKGAVLATGHLGNWEIGGAALAVRGIPLDAVAQPQENPLFDAALERMRSGLGMQVIDRRRATPLALRSLRRGRVVAFVADQDARGHGVFVPFFGRPASTHRGPALLALRTGAPVFVGTALRLPGGRYRIELDRVDPALADDPEEAIRRITAAFTARLEKAARRAPEQYFWLHRRWKTPPPQEL